MNAEKLSSGERAEMRDLVTSGARRMRIARARRMQTAAIAAAVVLVAAVVTSVSFAAFRPDDRVAKPVETTASPPPSPSPSPSTPSPTAAPPAPVNAVLPYGGDCANVLTTDQVAGWMGAPVRTVFPEWKSPEVSINGGLSCTWAYPDAYMWGALDVTMFPASIVSSVSPSPVWNGECAAERCDAAEFVDGMWVAVTWHGVGAGAETDIQLRTIGGPEIAELFALLRRSSAGYESPRAAERAASWWPANACDLVAEASPSLTRVPSAEMPDLIPNPGLAVNYGPTGLDGCTWEMPSGEQLPSAILPGAGYLFDDIAAASSAESVEIAGSDEAVYVRSNFVWEYNGVDIVMRSGTNLLLVRLPATVITDEVRAEGIELSETMLAILNGALA